MTFFGVGTKGLIFRWVPSVDIHKSDIDLKNKNKKLRRRVSNSKIALSFSIPKLENNGIF